MSAIIDHAVQARLRSEPARTLSADLRFDAADPLAVRLHFPPEASLDGTDVIWTFGRELLDDGLREPTGEGDVHVRPCLSDLGSTVVELRSPEGVAVLEIPSGELRSFLGRTYASAPAHGAHPDIDSALAALLRNA